MLIQFNFNNYKSYKNETSLDMTATSIKEHPYNLISNTKGEQYIKVAAIYGANASGKTAIIDAFIFMKHLVEESFKNSRKAIPLKRFAFNKQRRNEKAEFEVFFMHKDKEYQYGFTVDNKKVYQEWLYKRDFRGKEKYITLFERDNEKIRCGKGLKDAEKFIDLVEDSTLFLSLISNAKIKDAQIAFNWFSETKVIDFGDGLVERIIFDLMPSVMSNQVMEDADYQKTLNEFLKAIDVGIDGIRIEKSIIDDDDEDKIQYKVYSKHKNENGEEVEIPFSEESSGTKKMFGLYTFLVNSLTKGSTLIIDELDAKLHPLLLRYIIYMFHNPDINKNNAQLIYTTHDMFTLTKEIFRRDQIWFSEKDLYGVSKVFSLIEYKLENNKKVRNDATYNKDYLSGRYGAVPLLKEFNLLEEL